MYNGGSTALQRTLSQYSQRKRDAKIESSSPTALSGIGKWTKQGEEALHQGLTDPMKGEINMQSSTSMGTSFRGSQSNPWEAFLATPAEEMEREHQEGSQQGYWMQAYKPQARGVSMSFF